jgi:hypothetical protein
MFCNHCGKSISENSMYCSHCGSKQQNNEKPLHRENKTEKITDNKIKIFINENKGFVVFYLIWFFFHLIFLCAGDGDDHFWPFNNGRHSSEGLEDYGFMEFAFYLIVPIVIWAIWKLVGKEIDEFINPKK